MSIKRSSRLSFTCGLLSLMFCWFFWVPLYGIFISLLTIVLAVVAIITGGRIKKQKRTSPETVDPDCLRNARYGRVLGLIGIFIGLICFVLSILFTIYFKFLIQ